MVSVLILKLCLVIYMVLLSSLVVQLFPLQGAVVNHTEISLYHHVDDIAGIAVV